MNDAMKAKMADFQRKVDEAMAQMCANSEQVLSKAISGDSDGAAQGLTSAQTEIAALRNLIERLFIWANDPECLHPAKRVIWQEVANLVATWKAEGAGSARNGSGE